MTAATRAARQRGESWARSLARAEYAGPPETVREYARRRDAERAGLLGDDEQAAFVDAYEAAFAAEWARLSEEGI